MATKYENEHQHRGIDVDGSPVLENPKFGDVDGGNYSEIQTDGTYFAHGKGTCFKDINTSIQTGRVSASNAPTWAVFRGSIYQYQFAINDYIQIAPFEMMHDWLQPSPIEFHLHWATGGTDTTDRFVRWEIEYTFSNTLDDGGIPTAFPATTIVSAETKIPANTADRTHMYTSITTCFSPTSIIGCQILTRLRRITATGGSAPSSNPFAIQQGLHYEVDSLGSKSYMSKYTG